MHILFLSDNFPPETNACASRVYERALHWLDSGHQVTVITCAPNFPEGKVYPGYKNRWYQVEWMSGIRVLRVKTFMRANAGTLPRILDFLSFMLTGSIAGIFQRRSFDVVVATSPQLFCALGGWLVAKCRRRPFLFELSDLWPASIVAVSQMKPGRLIRMIEKLELFLYRQADRIVAQTRSFKADLVARGVRSSKIDVVYNGVELTKYQPQAKDSALLSQLNLKGRFVFSYIGTLGQAHDLPLVLEAMALLKKQAPQIALLFVGTGAMRDALVQQAQQAGLTNVTFIAKQPKSEIKRYWSITDVALVHLKNVATFATVVPSKIFEAFAMAKPVLLAAPEGEASDIVNSYQAGRCLPSGDAASLARCMQEMAAATQKDVSFADNAEHAAKDFSRARQAQAMLQSIDKLMDG